MIYFSDSAAERFQAIEKHSRETDSYDDFSRRMKTVRSYGCSRNCDVHIYTDFSLGAMALGFSVVSGEGKHILTGGLVYHEHSNTWGLHS